MRMVSRMYLNQTFPTTRFKSCFALNFTTIHPQSNHISCQMPCTARCTAPVAQLQSDLCNLFRENETDLGNVQRFDLWCDPI